ncbi:MAG: DUF2255 family protein [Candidatus Promineofilum sp.]|nr:DUF2255 family protein [Promineifilum sp.]
MPATNQTKLPGERPWTADELEQIQSTGEVHVSSRRDDGSYTRGQTIWAVVVGASVFVRSTDGPDKPWFRAARAHGASRFRYSGGEVAVAFHDAPDIDENVIEQAYRAKYHGSRQRSIDRAGSSRATLELVPVFARD